MHGHGVIVGDNDRVRDLRIEVLSDHWYVLRKATFDYRHRDGTWTREVREAYDRGNGVVILLYDPVAATVLLTRQFRLPVVPQRAPRRHARRGGGRPARRRRPGDGDPARGRGGERRARRGDPSAVRAVHEPGIGHRAGDVLRRHLLPRAAGVGGRRSDPRGGGHRGAGAGPRPTPWRWSTRGRSPTARPCCCCSGWPCTAWRRPAEHGAAPAPARQTGRARPWVAREGGCMPGPLEGVKVVELGVWIAGPAAGGVLADWGADVIKIEPPEGDPARQFGRMMGDDLPTNPVFELDNRGKRSVVLDLTTDDGKAAALDLLDEADVFVTNVRRVGAGAPRPRRRDAAGPQPAPRVRPHHRLRPRGPGRRQGGVRHRRVLVARRHRPPADRPRRQAAVPAWWDG